MVALQGPAKFRSFLKRHEFTDQDVDEILGQSTALVPVQNTNSVPVPVSDVDSILNATQVLFQGDKPVRVVVREDQPWFVAKDVADALGLKWSGQKSIRMVPDPWRVVYYLSTTLVNQHGELGQVDKETYLINEPAVYKLAFRSRKPEADTFCNWVVSEVLPQIRRTGQFRPLGSSVQYSDVPSVTTTSSTPVPLAASTGSSCVSTGSQAISIPVTSTSPVRDASWLTARAELKVAYKELSDTCTEQGLNGPAIGKLVNHVYERVTGDDAEGLRLRFQVRKPKPVADHLTNEELTSITGIYRKLIHFAKWNPSFKSSVLASLMVDEIAKSEPH